MASSVLSKLQAVTFVILFSRAFGEPSLNLTTSSNVSFCPGPILFTCVGTEVSFFLKWMVNGNQVASYSFDLSHDFPRNVSLDSTLHDVRVQIINGSVNQKNNATADVISTLRADVSILRGATVYCEFFNVMSEVYTVNEVRAPPFTPFLTSCSLLLFPGGPGISLLWNSSYNAQHAVERYSVLVIPDPSTCSRDVVPSEDYSCPGLVLGTQYTFTVSAINCGDQEGMGYTFTVQPKVQQNSLEVEVMPLYDSSSQLSEVRVLWRRQPDPSISERCDYEQTTVNYTVVLVSSTGERVDQRIVGSDSCIDGFCSTSFSPSSSDQTYHVSVSASNVFGESSNTSSMTFNSSSVFRYSLTFDSCMTSLLCSSPMNEKGQCFIQYSQDPSQDQEISQGPINSPFTLLLMDENTFYYYQINNTFGFQSIGNFTTGEFAVRLTPTNFGFLAVGVILLSIATIVGIVLIVVNFRTHKGSRLFLIMLVVGCVVVVLSIVLWVAVGFQVGLQKNTCDTNWQSSRDGLIITAFIFSFLSTLIIAAGILLTIGYICFKQDESSKTFTQMKSKKEDEPQQEEEQDKPEGQEETHEEEAVPVTPNCPRVSLIPKH